MDEFSIALTAIGGMVLALGLISRLLAQSIFMEPMIALLFGILLGPQVLNLLDLSRWGMRPELILEYVARLTLGIGLVAIALRIPKGFPVGNWRPLMSNLRGWGDALFVGWFGPIAIGALYYASFIQYRLGTAQIWTVTSLIICASIVVHGMTATPLSKLYGRQAKGRCRSGCAE